MPRSSAIPSQGKEDPSTQAAYELSFQSLYICEAESFALLFSFSIDQNREETLSAIHRLEYFLRSSRDDNSPSHENSRLFPQSSKIFAQKPIDRTNSHPMSLVLSSFSVIRSAV